VANPVVHFEIIGADGAALQSFYGDLFGWKIDSNNEWRYGMVESGGEGGIAGGIAADQGSDGHRVTVYAQVDDPQAYLDKAVELGATVVMPVTEMGEGMPTIAMFTDPAGNVTGLLKNSG
jgi:predicted enzyme related to lactoylglutathione lyase